MIQDDEFEALVTTPERVKNLGFKPQKEILTNHLLPYADELDAESTKFLDQIKTNLAKSVMLREMKPACGVWSSRLIKYIRIYGLKFSKEDHITFIKLVYELVLIPDLEPCKILKFATLFLMLTKKRHLISPEELTLPWRPLYELGRKIFNTNSTTIGLYHYLTSLEGSYVSMIKCSKPYFDVNATQEILAEFLPQLLPWGSDASTITNLTAFLPVALPPEHAAQGHLLWFDQLMTLWDTCYNMHSVSDLMMLFSGLAKKNPAAVDWTPHVPKLFTRFMHALNLPVSYKDMQYTASHGIVTKDVATWIVWAINPDGVVLRHLRCFLAGVESYLHSTNSGRWSYRLRDLLRKLSREFLNRVRREREKKFKENWENKTPESYKLRDEDITEFVNILLEPTYKAVYCRSGSLDISIALQNLANLRPDIVIPPLLDKLRSSLSSLTEPHRVTAAMSAVAAVARPMLRGPDFGYPEGPTHVVPLLMAVLPGLDPNDIKKTLVTLHFILIFSWMVPYIDCSSAHEYWPDLTEEELLTCESTAQMEDFVLIFLDRLFIIIESSVTEHARIDAKDTDSLRSKTDSVMESAFSSAATSVLMQCSPKIFNEALRKFKKFATETTFETSVSGNMVGILLGVFARLNSELTLAAFVPKLCEELKELLSTDEALQEENPPRDLVYRLVLLMNIVECDGDVLLKYIPVILPILDRALKLHSTYALTRAAGILHHICNSLSYIDLKEWRSSPEDYSKAPEKWLPIRQWGKGCLLKDADFKWHMPTEEQVECAQMLINRYLKPEIARIRQWLNGERMMCRKRRLRTFYIMDSVLSCGPFLPLPVEKPVFLMKSQVPPTSMPLTTGMRYAVTLDGENICAAVTRLLCDVQARLLADKTDDTRGLEMLIQVWDRVTITKGNRGLGLETRVRTHNALEHALDGRGVLTNGSTSGASGARVRMLLADAARLQDESRHDLSCDAGITPTAMTALHALYDLSINTYSSVRIQAQARLNWVLNRYPYSYNLLVPKLEALLAEGGEGDEWDARHKGALYILLGPRAGPLVAKQDWDVVKTLWPAVLKAPLSEKPVILKLEQAFSDTLHRQFPMVNTRLTFSQSTVDYARCLLTDSQLNEANFVEQLSKAVENEIEASNRRESIYRELVEELVNIAEAPNVQWRRLELAMQMLTYCPSIQTPYPPRAVSLVLRSLIHDDINVRRTAHRLTQLILKQRKRSVKKINVDPYEIAGIPRPKFHVPGYRKDLEWALYSDGKLLTTDEEWEKPWLRNPKYGFYAWPEQLKVAAPSSEQVFSSDISPENMEAGERHVLDFFANDANVNKLVSFLTVEEKKGKDKFNGTRFYTFVYLFSQFGEQLADKFIQHALRCASDTQEAPQRFAAEVAAAALRAPRFWSRDRAINMYNKALDIIKTGLSSVTPETLADWGTCLASGTEKIDPRRAGIVLSTLVEVCMPAPALDDADPDHDTSFAVCARLHALQGALSGLSWRAAPLAVEILQRLEAARFIQHPYQNVRDSVGSILLTIFDTELVFPGGEGAAEGRPVPCFAEFLASVQPRLAPLYDENGDIVIKTSACPSSMHCGGSEQSSVEATSPGPAARAPLVSAVSCDMARLSPTTHTEHHPSQDGEQEGGDIGEDSEDVARGSRLAKQLAARLDGALRLADEAALPAPRDHARALNLLTTVLRACIGVIIRGVSVATDAQYKTRMIRAACSLAARGAPQQHDETARAADGYLACLALAGHSPSAFDAALDELHALADERSWWARLASLDFAQPLLFYGLPMLCEQPKRAQRVEEYALKLMRDQRLEVCQSAAKLLTGLMHCRALPNEDQTLRALIRSCRSKVLLERHCGVLGLCAYLVSRPYSLPPKLGEVLSELCRHTNAPDPVPATIRASLAEFRRTHQDEWPRHRDQLTEEELDLLADLTAPPSYCA